MSDRMDPSKLKVVELKSELQSRGLYSKSNKTVLVERLREALEAENLAGDAKAVKEEAEDDEYYKMGFEDVKVVKEEAEDNEYYEMGYEDAPMQDADVKTELGNGYDTIVETAFVEIKDEILDPKEEEPSSETEDRRGEKRRAHSRFCSPDSKKLRPEVEKVRLEEEPDYDKSAVLLDWYNSDPSLVISKEDFLSAQPLTMQGFGYVWHGVRATYGFTRGRVFFEVKVVDCLPVPHLEEDEQHPHAIRVGWSIDEVGLTLGEDPFSYGYSSTGKASTYLKFKDYGKTFGKGDVVGCYLDLVSEPIVMSFTVNGENQGMAYEISCGTLGERSLFPHILTKNCSFKVNFGVEDPWATALTRYTYVGHISLQDRVLGGQGPATREEAEIGTKMFFGKGARKKEGRLWIAPRRSEDSDVEVDFSDIENDDDNDPDFRITDHLGKEDDDEKFSSPSTSWRTRGTLGAKKEPSEETPIQLLDVERLKAQNSVWHKEPNTELPRIVSMRIEDGAPTTVTDTAMTPSELFSLFLDAQLLNTICMHTNVKIAELREKVKDPNHNTFRNLELMELKGVLGILLMAGMKKDNHVPTTEMWSEVHGAPIYRSTMTERRFTFLLRALRFDDSTTQKDRMAKDRFAPIRNLWDGVIQHCNANYKPGPHLTVDEQLLAFNGNCIFRMYIPNKPAKQGLKLVMLCDSDTHYMCNAIPYLGKGSVQLKNPQTLGEYFTMKLASPYARRGRTITTDNWFTSLPLALSLRKSGMQLVGTIRSKPYLPRYLLSFKMDVGDSVAAFNYKAKVTLLCHRASKRKKVQFLSTIHHQPRVIERTKTDIQMFYNATKGGVDTFDQLCSSTSSSRKTCRWPLCIFYGIINIAFSNAHVLHSLKKGQQAQSRRDFGFTLTVELCRPWAMKRLQDHVTLPRTLRNVIFGTFSVQDQVPTSSLTATKTEKRQRCYICPRIENVKTRLLCFNCQKSVCPRHFVTFCHNCHY